MTECFTIPEAAAKLRAKPRWLTEWLRKHPADKAGMPFYTPVGRDKILHQNDIDRIELALREEVKCRSVSGRRVPVKRRTTKSAARTEGQGDHSAWRQAAELLNDPALLNSCEPSKSASTSTDNGRRPRLSLVQGSRPS